VAFGEDNGHEPIVFLLSGVVGIGGFAFGTHQCGGGRAVMSVGYIKCGNRGKNISNAPANVRLRP
jgi:hypothetical protein